MTDTGLSFRIDKDVKETLRILGEKEGRKVANYARHKLTELAFNDGRFACSKCKRKLD